MSNDVCPHWLGFTIDNPLRGWIFHPDVLFARWVRPGMTALDVGCGMGVNALSLAKLVRPGGRVIAADIQPRMLDAVGRRARKAGLDGIVRTHLCKPELLGVAGPVDFAVAFWMVHEVPDARALFAEIRACLAPGGQLLVAEPRLHVNRQVFDREMEAARAAGLSVTVHPAIPLSRSALLSVAG
jgi:ubiquinone/menaquinone biosynthesis C-methylase UbiE